MKGIELVKINRFSMEVMSKIDIRQDDYRYVDLYEDYLQMRGRKEKFRYAIAVLSERYGVSESTAKRIVKRLSREVNM